MLPHPNSPAVIVAVCGALWFAIWWSARDEKVRYWVIGIAILSALLGSCSIAATYAQQAQDEQLCAISSALCRQTHVEWRPWLPLAISLAIVFLVTTQLNTPIARSFTEKVLAGGPQAPWYLYIMALVLRMQLVIIGFIEMSALFWLGDSGTGPLLLTVTLMVLLFTALPISLMLWPILSIAQLGKCQKVWGWIFGMTPAVYALGLLSHKNSTWLLDYFDNHGGDARYLALVIIFGSLCVYSGLGRMLAGKLHSNLESLSHLTDGRTGESDDPGHVLGKLRRLKRSAHAISMITAGIAIGFMPPALRLSDVLGMIIGVGFVSLISYLDAELASRQVD